MPTIAELLNSYRDRTGYSYKELAARVRDELQANRLHQLATQPPREFPKHPRTIELLAELLEVPVTTILLAFAAGLGLPVAPSGSMLAITLPPGTDTLEPEDVAAIRTVTRALVRARQDAQAAQLGELEAFAEIGRLKAEREPSNVVDLARPPAPDLSRVAARKGSSSGKAARDAQDRDAED